MTSYLSHLVYTGSHEKRETRMGTSGYDFYDVYLWILICVYSVVSHPCVIISMLILSIGPDPSPVRPNIIGGKGLASETNASPLVGLGHGFFFKKCSKSHTP